MDLANIQRAQEVAQILAQTTTTQMLLTTTVLAPIQFLGAQVKPLAIITRMPIQTTAPAYTLGALTQRQTIMKIGPTQPTALATIVIIIAVAQIQVQIIMTQLPK
jgi:hypothetical protein